ncbi:MAG TPA: HRDC domain-containing protein, partial [Acidimicrobiales bacterium]
LRRWRETAARAARIEPQAVLADHVLARVAAAEPTSVEELGAIRGVGPLLATRFGDAIMRAIRLEDAGVDEA